MSGPMRSRVDWDDVHRRMEAMLRAVAGGGDASPDAAREVLEARARALAEPPPAPAEGGALRLVTFSLAGETYALESRHVVEMARLERPTPLPGAAPPLFAVTAWRGELLGIHDLRALLGLAPRAEGAGGWMVVLGEGAPALALAADAPGEFR
ncbi:MAG TPA: chemotaxis protein CheW, partial [Longimicrobium sp.]|nr:chemotaxis protein CheW [Longimicrobium sp.]